MEQEMVSVVIPAYNAENKIAKCLKSILEQTYKNLEIIVINDGSIDNTCSIIKQFALEDCRIKYFYQKNSGVSAARNLGIRKVHGKYMTFVDADDYVRKDFIEKMVYQIKQCDLVICGYNWVHNTVVPILLNQSGEVSEEEYFEHTFCDRIFSGSCCNKLFHTEIVCNNKVVFPEQFIINEDTVFCILYYQYCKTVFYLSEPLYQYCYNEQSCTHLKYKNKMFDLKQLDLIKSMEFIEEVYNCKSEYAMNCMRYKKMRFCVNLMFQMIICNDYTKEVVKRIMEIIRKKNSLRISYEFGDKIICMALIGIYLSPKMVYMGGKMMYRIFRKQIDNYLD